MNQVLKDNHGRKIGEIIDQGTRQIIRDEHLASLMENTLVMIMKEK